MKIGKSSLHPLYLGRGHLPLSLSSSTYLTSTSLKRCRSEVTASLVVTCGGVGVLVGEPSCCCPGTIIPVTAAAAVVCPLVASSAWLAAALAATLTRFQHLATKLYYQYNANYVCNTDHIATLCNKTTLTIQPIFHFRGKSFLCWYGNCMVTDSTKFMSILYHKMFSFLQLCMCELLVGLCLFTIL